MDINNVLFHNADELEETKIGYKLKRYKTEVTNEVNDNARYAHRVACGCEIRFVCDAPQINIKIFSEGDYGTIIVYKGDYMHSTYRAYETGYMNFTIGDKPHFNQVSDEFFNGNLFSKDVWRIYFHCMSVQLVDIDTYGYEIKPPTQEQMPKKTLLSYGSSISHGFSTLDHAVCYPQIVAKSLGMDCLIKGTSGSCFADEAAAADFASRDDWDIAMLEIGVNMLSHFTSDEFKARFDSFIDKMYATGKKLIIITPFTCMYHYEENNESTRIKEYEAIIRGKCAELDPTRYILVDGKEIVNKTKYLHADCIHPTTEGHVMMGVEIVNKIKDFI